MKRWGLWLGLFLALILLWGCIRSRVVVTSDPTGADVTMNNVYRGRTPITIQFAWYWYYDFKVEKEGFRPVTARERFHAPPWFYIPFDLVMEVMPFRISDVRYRHYSLTQAENE